MAKKLTPQKLVRRMMETLTQGTIGEILGLSKRQVQRIATGKASGASVEAPLREFNKLGKRAKAAVVAGDLPLPSKRTPAPKKVKASFGEPAPVPKEKEIVAPPAPRKVDVTIRGHIGPSSDPDYVRKRTIRKTLEGEHAARFAELFVDDEFKALKYATSVYFGSAGAGHLESVIGKPEIYYTY
jgi:hypothetical protein